MAAVAVFGVVPLEELPAEVPRLLDVGEPARGTPVVLDAPSPFKFRSPTIFKHCPFRLATRKCLVAGVCQSPLSSSVFPCVQVCPTPPQRRSALAEVAWPFSGMRAGEIRLTSGGEAGGDHCGGGAGPHRGGIVHAEIRRALSLPASHR